MAPKKTIRNKNNKNLLIANKVLENKRLAALAITTG